MSSFGSQLRKRMEVYRRIGGDIRTYMSEAAEGATIEAVRVATENTPPNGAKIAGTNTRSGQMARHWQLDSQTSPKWIYGGVETVLANNMQYASYVDKGHRMDKHFVPGLIQNGNVLEKVDPDMGGIMVGTKTTYVKGLYMTEKAKKRYRTVVRKELEKRIKEAFK